MPDAGISPEKDMLGIGIDTGGTCTDAVIYDFDTKEILAGGKALTTKQNLEIGIGNALDTLPQELIGKAEMISLSTTLATNACLENKGARAKLLMIGFDESLMDHLKDIYASYGLKDRTRFIILDAKVERLYSHPFDPDWEDLRRRAPEYFADCDSIGIVQKHPRANGGRFELTAQKILGEELDLPITISFDISNEVDILKTCAGTMLNARLIPIITEFMQAVRHVMEQRNLQIPMTIVRSNGTMMPEETAKMFPVETILCGPAASVVGGCELAGEEDGIIVDMGGTTTDIAIVRDRFPVAARDGIKIGQWKTMVKGLYVDTVGLGGDSAVRFKDDQLYLDTVRVIPLSVLASQYDHVLPELQDLAQQKRASACWIHEYYVLLRDISDKAGYTEFEQRICQELKEKPLITMELADRLHLYPKLMKTDRLEADGVIIKSGLTPTDMMILKGDFTLYNREAAEAALQCLLMNIRTPLEQVPDLVYDMVCRRMYHSIGRVILQQQFPKEAAWQSKEQLKPMLDCFYEQAKAREKEAAEHSEAAKKDAAEYPGGRKKKDAVMALTTEYPLIGVGAPIHVFLPRVASLLGTRAVIPEHAGVANAVGAAASRIIAECELIVKAEYMGAEFTGFIVYENGKQYRFENDQQEEAVAFGKEVITRMIRKRAKLLGIEGEPNISITEYENRFGHSTDGILFEIKLTAKATPAE